MNVSRDFIEKCSQAFPQMPLMYEVLRAKGQEYNEKAPIQPVLMDMGQCFHNAYLLAMYSGLTYVEGLAVHDKVGIPMEHAWCIDEKGLVCDPTWDDGRDYFGMPVRLYALEDMMQRTKCYGLFGNLHMLRDVGVEGVRQFLMDAAIEESEPQCQK